MAVYCSTSDVKALNSKRVYNTTSKPTAVQITSFIAWVSSDINVRFGAVGLTMPVATSPATDVSRFLKMLCAHGAAGMAEESAFMGGNRQDSEHSNSLLERYESWMEKIEDNPDIISGLSGAAFDSYEYSNIDKRRDADDEPFERDEDEW